MAAMNAIGRAIDSVVGVFSPGRALHRVRERALLGRAFEAASPKDGFRPRRSTASANTDHLMDAGVMRGKARALVQNVPYIAQGLRSLVNNTIGTGIVPRSKAKNATKIDAIFSEWAKVADADGRLDWYGLQAAAYRAMKQDGEVLLRIRPRRIEDNLPVPMQVQLLEIDWLDGYKNESVQGGGRIIGGIQYSPLGAVEGYWLYDLHPGDFVPGASASMFRASRFVPAAKIIHLYNPDRPGQGRGFTQLASIIARVRDLMLYEDAELARKNTESRTAVIVSGNPDFLREQPQNLAPTTDARDLGTLSSGSIIGVPEGASIATMQPHAAPGYVEYLRFNLHLIAAGLGVTYPMLTGDVSQANFVSERVNLIEFRRNAEAEQWLILIPKLCTPVWDAFIDAGYDAGVISDNDKSVDHSTPKWEYVNPKDDVTADQLQIASGLTSVSETLRRRGYKPDEVFKEIKADFDRLKADGTLDILMTLQARQAPRAEIVAP